MIIFRNASISSRLLILATTSVCIGWAKKSRVTINGNTGLYFLNICISKTQTKKPVIAYNRTLPTCSTFGFKGKNWFSMANFTSDSGR